MNSPRLGALLAVVSLVLGGTTRGDTVRLQTGDDLSGTVEITGEIVDYTGREIVVRRPGARDQAYPASRVLGVDTRWPEGYEAGRAALAARDFPTAIAQFTAAARTDQRPWVRRLLMLDLMRSYSAQGNWLQSGELFVSLATSDPATPALDEAPLAWFALSGVPRSRVEGWLQSDLPAAQLLGASHALSTNLRGEALQVLQRLRTSPDPRIALLAETQIWRTEMVTAKLADVEQWQRILDRNEAVRGGGPWLVVGEALARHNQTDRGMLAYLRVPVLSGQQRQLAARGLLAAAQLAVKQGRTDEAERMLAELTRDYPDTPPAEQGGAMLQSLRLE